MGLYTKLVAKVVDVKLRICPSEHFSTMHINRPENAHHMTVYVPGGLNRKQIVSSGCLVAEYSTDKEQKW